MVGVVMITVVIFFSTLVYFCEKDHIGTQFRYVSFLLKVKVIYNTVSYLLDAP